QTIQRDRSCTAFRTDEYLFPIIQAGRSDARRASDFALLSCPVREHKSLPEEKRQEAFSLAVNLSMHLGQISDSNLSSQVLPAPERANHRSASRGGVHVLFDYCPTMKIALSKFFQEQAKI